MIGRPGSNQLAVGLRCTAPILRNGRRKAEEVSVVWVSTDGAVAEVVTMWKAAEVRGTFARCRLADMFGVPLGAPGCQEVDEQRRRPVGGA